MATITKKKGTPKPDVAWQETLPVVTVSRATEPAKLTAEQRVYWGDWLAFKFWITGFLIMAAMSLYDLIAGLFRS
jgi:hypothetical protein